MGKIERMQNFQNSRDITNTNIYKRKPPMNKKGIIGFLTTIGPTAKNYTIDQDQRKVQLYGRVATFAALLGAGLLVVGGKYVGNSIGDNVAQTQEILQENELMDIAKDKLLESFFGDELKNIDNPEVTCSTDRSDGSKQLTITSGTDDSKTSLYTYSKNLSLDSTLNPKEISSLIDSMIEVDLAHGASAKQLKELNEAIEAASDKNFTFENGHFVEDKELDLDDYER